jgi:hypothetical protein
MKRLTAKDMAEQKKEIAKQHQQHQSSQDGGVNHGGPSRRDGDPPDFYSLSRDNPLPTPIDNGSGVSGGRGNSPPLPATLSTFLQGSGGAPVAAPPAAASYSAPTHPFVANMQAPAQQRTIPTFNQLPLHHQSSTSQDPNQNLMSLMLALGGNRPAAPAPQPPQTDVASLLALLAHAMNPASPMSLLLKAISNSQAPPPVAAPNMLGGMGTSGPTSDLLIQALAHALLQSNRQVAAPAPPPPQGPDLQQQLILQLLSSLLAPSAAGTSPAVGNGATNETHAGPAPEITVRPQRAASPLAPSDVQPPPSSSTATQQVSPLLQALLGGLSSGIGAAAPPPSATVMPKPVSPSPALPADPAQLPLLLQLLASQQQQPSSAGTQDASSKLGSPTTSSEAVPAERGPSPS